MLDPAAAALGAGVSAGGGRLLPDVVAGVAGGLLAHLLKTRARISASGARQLQTVKFTRDIRRAH